MSSRNALVRIATDARLLKRGCESLLGICNGLLADGELNDKEIMFLDAWLADNQDVANAWPGEVICHRVRAILADRVVSNDERENLAETLRQLIGGSFIDDGAAPCGSTTLPVDDCAQVDIVGKSFCFTGNFVFGTRRKCSERVLGLGGNVSDSVVKSLDYLVIGELSSRDWRNTSFGTKIEKAVSIRELGGQLKIISEAQWNNAFYGFDVLGS